MSEASVLRLPVLDAGETEAIGARYREEGVALVRSPAIAACVDDVVEGVNDVFERTLERLGVDVDREPGRLLGGEALNRLHVGHRAEFLLCWEAIRRLVPLMRLTALEEVVGLAQAVGVRYPILSSYPAVRVDLASQPEQRNFPPHREMMGDLGSLNAVAIWIPLQDVDEETGTGMLRVGLGSHLDAEIAEGAGSGGLKYAIDDPAYAVERLSALPMQKGDCAVFTFHTVHASGRIPADLGARGSVQLRFDDLDDFAYAGRGWPQNFSVVQR